MKEDGSLRLCLDPKDLNKAIERNQWYARTLDDILPERAQSKYFTIKDATSGFWHVPLDLRSSLLTMFNMPWGKYRWLRMPFGLKVSGDVFQERLDKVLRLVPGVLGIADDIVIHGPTENTHNGTVLILCETARLNNLSLNSKKMQFKSTDCKFFGHRLTPDGIKVDPKKIEAIIQMDPPQNLANLQSFNDMINYLKKFSTVLSKLSEPLRRLCKSGVIWAWESEQQDTFEAIKQVITSLPVLAYFNKTIDSNIDVIPVYHITQSAPISKTRLQELRLATQSDPTLRSLAKTVHEGWPQSKKDCPEQLLDWSFRQEISEEDGLFYKNHRLIMPYSERLETLKVVHLGHYAIDKMQLRALETVYWPGINKDILKCYQSCKTCIKYSKS